MQKVWEMNPCLQSSHTELYPLNFCICMVLHHCLPGCLIKISRLCRSQAYFFSPIVSGTLQLQHEVAQCFLVSEVALDYQNWNQQQEQGEYSYARKRKETVLSNYRQWLFKDIKITIHCNGL